MTFQRNWGKCKRVISLLMRKVYSTRSWVRGPWSSMTKDLQKAILGKLRLRIKFKQNLASENWYKYKKLRNKCANLLKKTKNIIFVKTDIKNNRSQNLLEHNSAFAGSSRTSNHNILNEGGLIPFTIHGKMKSSTKNVFLVLLKTLI